MVTTSVGGLKEMIGDSGTGIVTGSVAPEAIRQAIEMFFSSADIRNRCIESIAKEKDRLSWPRFCSRVLDFYNRL